MIKPFLRYAFPLLMIFWALGFTGCVDKMVYPSARFTVVGVEPHELTVASAAVLVLPTAAISLRSDFQIPSNLKSFSVTYKTRLGQPIPQIAIPETSMDLLIAGGGTTVITMKPYARRVADFYNLTTSDVSPITATMILTIHDINGNTTQVETYCLLFKPE